MAPALKKRRKAIKIQFDENDHIVNGDDTGKNANKMMSVNGNSKEKSFPSSSSSSLWKKHLENIKQMRSGKTAPVDSMGCHMLADKLAEPKRLREHGCTVDDIIAISTEDLEQLLIPVGFYKKKAVYIKKVAAILKERYDSDIPSTVEELCSLPGVGEKMAYLAMHNAWDQLEGLGVDTHVHRITNRLGWVKTSNPKQTRIALEALVPREQWQELNKLLVGFGQETCLPTLPKCSQCLNNGICDAAGVKKKR